MISMPLPFLSLVCFILSLSSRSMSQPNCLIPFKCGNFTAGYPFWGGDRPSGCGHPDLHLYCGCDGIRETYFSYINKINCEPDRPIMVMYYDLYSILNIDEKAQILRIASVENLTDMCFPSQLYYYISPLLDFDPGNKMFNLFYNCSASLSASFPGRFKCLDMIYDNYNRYDNLYVAAGGISPPAGTCAYSFSLPVSRSSHLSTIRNWSDLAQAVEQGFEVKWNASGISCGECQSNGNCGYDSQLNRTLCYCPNGLSFAPCSTSPVNQAPEPEESPPSSGSFSNKRRNIFIGVAASLVGIMIILFVLLMSGLGRKLTLEKALMIWKKKIKNDKIMEAFVRNYGSLAPKRYNYSDVKKMTNSFSNKLGQGGYGDVFKGNLPDGTLVAVKVLKESKGNGEEFINEVANISRTSHVNIVTLLGFCCEHNKRALIYEFMPNGSLDKFIYDEESMSSKRNLEWRTMYQISVGIARGLEYLHRGCNIRIVHFDIKPHNILLDEDFRPKISDFGLAKQSKEKESFLSMLDARGTIGYIAPEVFCKNFGGASHKSDVYSYGMMILEMVGGRKNIDARVSRTSEIYFPHWLSKHLEPGKEEDFKLRGVATEEEKEMAKKMIIVSLRCIQTIPSDRPSMTKVVEMLEGSLEKLQIPPKPSPNTSPQHRLASQGESCSKLGDM